MKIAFIYRDKRIKTGAGYINGLISEKLKQRGVEVVHFYPKLKLFDAPMRMRGLNNILFFFSLLEHRNRALACDIIQGTTYTPIAFLPFSTPIITHFGSTNHGFMSATPYVNEIDSELRQIWHELKRDGVINELNLKTRRPLKDIADIEKLSARRSSAVIATSEIVKKELESVGVSSEKIKVIHNAIEDFWFEGEDIQEAEPPGIVYLGRIGEDVFTFKLKGLDRAIKIYRAFPDVPKLSIIMTANKEIGPWMRSKIPNHAVSTNLYKPEIKQRLGNLKGSVIIITSRYEGFCLSMIEGMSQGLIPVVFPVGVAPEIIKNGENGYLVNSTKEMTEAIQLVLRDEELRKKLSSNAMKTAEDFSSDKMVDQLVSVYSEIISQKPNKYEKRINKNNGKRK